MSCGIKPFCFSLGKSQRVPSCSCEFRKHRFKDSGRSQRYAWEATRMRCQNLFSIPSSPVINSKLSSGISSQIRLSFWRFWRSVAPFERRLHGNQWGCPKRANASRCPYFLLAFFFSAVWAINLWDGCMSSNPRKRWQRHAMTWTVIRCVRVMYLCPAERWRAESERSAHAAK